MSPESNTDGYAELRMRELGRQLRDARRLNRLTIDQVAASAGFTADFVLETEAGKIVPDFARQLCSFADATRSGFGFQFGGWPRRDGDVPLEVEDQDRLLAAAEEKAAAENVDVRDLLSLWPTAWERKMGFGYYSALEVCCELGLEFDLTKYAIESAEEDFEWVERNGQRHPEAARRGLRKIIERHPPLEVAERAQKLIESLPPDNPADARHYERRDRDEEARVERLRAHLALLKAAPRKRRRGRAETESGEWGGRLISKLKKAGVSQREFARRLGVSRQYVSQLAQRNDPPSIERVQAIDAALREIAPVN